MAISTLFGSSSRSLMNNPQIPTQVPLCEPFNEKGEEFPGGPSKGHRTA